MYQTVQDSNSLLGKAKTEIEQRKSWKTGGLAPSRPFFPLWIVDARWKLIQLILGTPMFCTIQSAIIIIFGSVIKSFLAVTDKL